ncbi:hypothetical protein vseg_016074 [Gypsophila vaccaria]
MHHHNEDDKRIIEIEIRYKDYREGISDMREAFTLPLEDDLTWDNIDDSGFLLYVEDYLEKLEVDPVARWTVIEATTTGYLRMKESSDHPSCLVGMTVYVEVDEFDEDVQGFTMDLDQDYYDNSDDGDYVGSNGDDDKVEETRAFLINCGVGFGIGSSGARCVICLDEIMTRSEAARLPCSHVFHGECLVNMVAKGGTTPACPLCRFELTNLVPN